jgi:hypothetical protein
MKIIFSILILLSISFNAKADHDNSIEVSSYEIASNGIYLYVYNKTSKDISPKDYVWWVAFDDDTKRLYKTTNNNKCYSYSDCTFLVEIKKKGFNNIVDAHPRLSKCFAKLC